MSQTEQIQALDAKYNNSNGFFGFELDSEAPIPVCDSIAFLRERGMRKEGVFRSAGSVTKVQDLQDIYNKMFNSKERKALRESSVLNNYDPKVTVSDVASLLKAFFTNLPSPLIPFPVSRRLFKIIENINLKTEDLQVQEKSKKYDKDRSKLMELLHKATDLPEMNLKLFNFLLHFLRELEGYRLDTKMTAHNLGFCWALALFHVEPLSNNDLQVSNLGTKVLALLITSEESLRLPDMELVSCNTLYQTNFRKRGGSFFQRIGSLIPGRNKDKDTSMRRKYSITSQTSQKSNRSRPFRSVDVGKSLEMKSQLPSLTFSVGTNGSTSKSFKQTSSKRKGKKNKKKL